MDIIYNTGKASLIIQIITLCVDGYVLTLDIKPSNIFLKNLVIIEVIVQFIELSFYIWLITNFNNITNITPYRYYDWFITTPSMLFTYSMYLYFINHKEKFKDQVLSFYDVVKENTPMLVPIFILNTFMLFFGYLAEIGAMGVKLSTFLGFIPFFFLFYLIYDNYAKYSTIGQITFFYFVSIWGLYGVAALLPYKYKNVFYNILDLFSKNFFGIFLAIVLLYNN
jgi:hypothetical protein